MRTPSLHRFRTGLLAFGLVSGVLVACGDDGSTSTTDGPTTQVPTTPAATTPAPGATDMGSNVESLSYLIQGLLTTEQIGGGWVDQGRRIIPPGSDQLTGFLCPDGEAAVRALGGRFDPQVGTDHRRPDDVGLSVSESLMWGDREQVTADFETFTSAVEGCAGTPYTTTDIGELTLVVEDPPAVGVAAFAFRFAPTTTPTDTPWIDSQTTLVLLSDPAEPIALVLWVGATTVHDPAGTEVTTIDPAEYTRIVETAVSRIVDEGL